MTSRARAWARAKARARARGLGVGVVMGGKIINTTLLIPFGALCTTTGIVNL